MVERLHLPQSGLMQNPMTYLTSIFQEPQPEQPLDARIVKTFAKWEAVQMAADDMHATFEVMPLHDAGDLLQYQQMLTDYAAYTVYAALMKQRLDQLMPGADVDDYAAALHQYHVEAELPSAEVIRDEIEAEMAPLREQLNVSLSVSPSSWVQRVQQNKQPLQLIKDEGHTP